MTKYASTELFFFTIGTDPHRKPSPDRQSNSCVWGRPPAYWAEGPALGTVAAWLGWAGTDSAHMVRGVGRQA